MTALLFILLFVVCLAALFAICNLIADRRNLNGSFWLDLACAIAAGAIAYRLLQIL